MIRNRAQIVRALREKYWLRVLFFGASQVQLLNEFVAQELRIALTVRQHFLIRHSLLEEVWLMVAISSLDVWL
jgi:hypothetical protein